MLIDVISPLTRALREGEGMAWSQAQSGVTHHGRWCPSLCCPSPSLEWCLHDFPLKVNPQKVAQWNPLETVPLWGSICQVLQDQHQQQGESNSLVKSEIRKAINYL